MRREECGHSLRFVGRWRARANPLPRGGGNAMSHIRLCAVLVLGVLTGTAPAQEKVPAKGDRAVKTVAVLVFDGVELLDFAGPAEVFAVADHGKAFKVVTVAEKAGDVRTSGGVVI